MFMMLVSEWKIGQRKRNASSRHDNAKKRRNIFGVRAPGKTSGRPDERRACDRDDDEVQLTTLTI
jgi:hypothetical protein